MTGKHVRYNETVLVSVTGINHGTAAAMLSCFEAL